MFIWYMQDIFILLPASGRPKRFGIKHVILLVKVSMNITFNYYLITCIAQYQISSKLQTALINLGWFALSYVLFPWS